MADVADRSRVTPPAASHVGGRVEDRAAEAGSARPYSGRWTTAVPARSSSSMAASRRPRPRSGNIVRSPRSSTSTTTQPVRPSRWGRTSTPAAASLVEQGVADSVGADPPDEPRRGPGAATATATLAPLPPRERRTVAGLSVPARGVPDVHTTTSSTRSPMTVMWAPERSGITRAPGCPTVYTTAARRRANPPGPLRSRRTDKPAARAWSSSYHRSVAKRGLSSAPFGGRDRP